MLKLFVANFAAQKLIAICCVLSFQIAVIAQPCTHTAEAGDNITVCTGEEVFLNGSASGGSGNYSYSWSPEDNIEDGDENKPNPKANPDQPNPFMTETTTTYILMVTDDDDETGCQASDVVTVRVINRMTIDAGNDGAVCFGESARLGGTPTAIQGSGNYVYSWMPANFLDDATAANPVASLPQAITYTFTLTVTDFESGCEEVDEVEITVRPEITADAGQDATICDQETVQIGGDPAGSGAPDLDYAWSPEVSATGSLDDNTSENPIFTPTANNTGLEIENEYQLTVTDPSTGCSRTDDVSIFVRPSVVVDAGEDATICIGNTADLGGDPSASLGTGNYSYDWEADDHLDDPTISNPVFTATIAGEFVYTLTVNDGSACIGTDTVTVTVSEQPIADAGPDTEVCPTGTVQVGGDPTGSSGTGQFTYEWTATDGSFDASNVANPNYSHDIEGFYTLTVVITDILTGCIDEDDVVVEVYEPIFADAGVDTAVCERSEFAIGGRPTARGTSTYSYEWTSADPFGDTEDLDDPTKANPTFTVPPLADFQVTAIYNYSVKVVDLESNCESIDEVQITVTRAPTVNAGDDTEICNGATTQLGGTPTASRGSGNYTYEWSPSDFFDDITIANPTWGAGAPEGVYTLYIDVIDETTECAGEDSVVVTVNESPIIDAGKDTILCSIDSVVLGGNPTAAGSGTYLYQWTPPNNLTTPVDANPIFRPTEAGEYNISVDVTELFGGCGGTDEVTVVVYDALIVEAGEDLNVCNDAVITLGGEPTVDGGSGDFTLLWTPADFLSGTDIPNPIFNHDVAGSYDYTLAVLDNVSGCELSDFATVIVSDTPVVDAGPDTILCNLNPYMLGEEPLTSSTGETYSYLWSPSDNLDDATIANPTYSPAEASEVTFTLIVTSDQSGCTDEDVVTVVSYSDMIVDAGDDFTVCTDGNVQLGGLPTADGASGNYQFTWAPDQFLSNNSIANPTFAHDVSGTYTYSLMVVDIESGCEVNDVTNVIVSDTPVINAGRDTALCNLDEYVLGESPLTSTTGETYSYLWEPSNRLNDRTLPNPTYDPISPGTIVFTVTVTSDQTGCTDEDEVTVITYLDLIVDAGDDFSVCTNGDVVIGGNPSGSGGSGTYEYTWTPVDYLSESDVPNPTFAYDVAGDYKYKLRVEDPSTGCFLIDSTVVMVADTPVANAGVDTTLCSLDSFVLGTTHDSGDPSITYSFAWSPEEELDDPSKENPIYTPSERKITTFTLVVTADQSGCFDVDEVEISAFEELIVDAGADQTICDDEIATLGGDPTVSGGTGNWSINWTPVIDGLSDNLAANPTFESVNGEYTFYLEVGDKISSCLSYDTTIVTINEGILLDAGRDTATCASSPIVIGGNPTATEGSGQFTYEWMPANLVSDSSLSNPVFATEIPGTYTMSLSVTDEVNGCVSEDEVIIEVFDKLVISAAQDSILNTCFGEDLTLGDAPTVLSGSGQYSINWVGDVSVLSDPSASNPTFFAQLANNYFYYLNIEDVLSGCSATDSVTVNVFSAPIADAGKDTIICQFSELTLGGQPTASGGSSFYKYTWQPLASTEANPSIEVLESEIYEVVVFDTVTECSANDFIKVESIRVTPADAGPDKGVCLGETVEIGVRPFNVPSNVDVTWTAEAGLLDDITVSNPMFTGVDTGIYKLFVTWQEQGTDCPSIDSVIVEVYKPLIINLPEELLVCQGDVYTLNDLHDVENGSGDFLYVWKPNNEVNNDNGVYTFSSQIPRETTLTLVVQDNVQGCSAEKSLLVKNKERPIVRLSNQDAVLCVGEVLSLQAQVTSSLPFESLWESNNSIFRADRLRTTLIAENTSVVTFTATEPNSGCFSSESFELTVFDKPDVNAGDDDTICIDEILQLNGESVSNGSGNVSYVWTPGEELSDPNVLDPTVRIVFPRVFTLTAIDQLTNCTSSDEVVIEVFEKYNVFFNRQAFCIKETPSILATTEHDITWSGPGIIDNKTGEFDPQVAGVGFHEITYRIVDNFNGCVVEDEVNIEVLETPRVELGFDISRCGGDSVSLGDNLNVEGFGAELTYFWEPSLNIDDVSSENPNAYPNEPTRYTLTVMDKFKCSGSDDILVNVFEKPTVSIPAKIDYCNEFQSFDFNIQGGQPEYMISWEPADKVQNPTKLKPGFITGEVTSYTVTVFDQNECKDIKSVVIDPKLVADIEFVGNICEGESVQLGQESWIVDGNPPFSFSWSPANTLNSSILENPMASPRENTVYTLDISDQEGCRAGGTVEVLVSPAPNVDAGLNKSVCFEGTPALIGIDTITSFDYDWKPTTGLSNSRSSQVAALPDETTTYTVSATNEFDCTVKDIVTVFINDPIEVSLESEMVCANLPFTIGEDADIKGGVGPFKYKWEPSELVENDSSLITEAVLEQSTSLVLEVTDAFGCTGSAALNVDIIPAPTLNAGADTTVCGDLVNFQLGAQNTITGGAIPYDILWEPINLVSNSSIERPTTSVKESVMFTLSVSDAAGCFAQDSIFVQIGDVPSAVLAANVSLCDNKDAELGPLSSDFGGLPPYNFNWSPNTFVSEDSIAYPVFGPKVTTTYTLTITDALGCTSNSSMRINVLESPTVDAGIDTVLCEVAEIELGGKPTASGGTGEYTYDWAPKFIFEDPTVANPVVKFEGSQEYSVFVLDANGCISSDTRVVQTDPTGELNIETIVDDNVAYFTVTNNGVSNHNWSFGDGTNSSDQTPSHYYPDNGIYSVCVDVETAFGCLKSTCVDVEINVSSSIDYQRDGSMLTMSPNPANTFVDIDWSFEANKLRVLDRLGKVVKELDVEVGQSTMQISVNELAIGVYTVQLTDGLRQETKQLVITR